MRDVLVTGLYGLRMPTLYVLIGLDLGRGRTLLYLQISTSSAVRMLTCNCISTSSNDLSRPLRVRVSRNAKWLPAHRIFIPCYRGAL